MRKTNLLLVLGISLSILLPAQFCNAQLSVQSYALDDDHIGWAIGPDNTGCKRESAADEDYTRKGGTRNGLWRFNGLQQECSNNQYGCYALIKGTFDNGKVDYRYVSGDPRATTKEQAIELVRDPAFAAVSVLVAGCIPKPEPAPGKPAPTTSSGNWSEWIKNDCFSRLTYQYRTKELLDLNYQFHYYFQAKNDYPVTVYFILSLKDADGRERFGTRHTIPPGGTIQFVEKMDKNYIRSMAIERVRFRSDVGEYAACGADPTTAAASKIAPANKPPDTNGIDLAAGTIKQKILNNLKANIRTATLSTNAGSLEATNVSVDSRGDEVTMQYSEKYTVNNEHWASWTQTENASLDQMARGLKISDFGPESTHLILLATGGECTFGNLIEQRIKLSNQSCTWLYDAGPNQQNYNELKTLLGQLSGGPSSDTTRNTASTSKPLNKTPGTKPSPAKTSATSPATQNSTPGGTNSPSSVNSKNPSGGQPSNPTQNTASTSQPVNTTPIRNTPPTNTGGPSSNPTQNTASTARPANTMPVTTTSPTNTAPGQTTPQEYFDRGNSNAEKGRYDLAIADYTKSIQMNPNNARVFNNRGLAYAETKASYDLAIADLTKAIQIDPNFAEAYNYRGYVYNLKDSSDVAIADCTKALQINPNYANAYHNRGLAYDKKGSYDLAIADYTKSIQINPDDAESYYTRGLAYTQKESYDQAIADYTKAIQIDPNDADAYLTRGNAYAAKGSYDPAISDYTKAIQINPNDADTYTSRGLAYVNKGSYDPAIADCTKAIQINPGYALAYYYRGMSYAGKGRYDLAIADYTKVIQSHPDIGSAYYNRGQAYSNKGSYDLAIADYSKAIQINPKDADTYTNRGLAYANKGSYDLAIADHTKAGELDPKNLNVYHTLAWTYFYQGKPVLAHQKSVAYLELNGLAGDSAPYAVIVGYLGLLKSGEKIKADEFLSGWLKQVKDDAWTTKIMRYFHGEITAAQLLALATDNDKLTEAQGYIGEIQLINKSPDTAKVHFEWVRANGNKSFFEYTLALAELKRLSQ